MVVRPLDHQVTSWPAQVHPAPGLELDVQSRGIARVVYYRIESLAVVVMFVRWVLDRPAETGYRPASRGDGISTGR